MVLRIFKMITTSGFRTALECTKFVFGTPLGELTALPRPPSWFKVPYVSREGEGRERGKEKGKGRVREVEGQLGPPFANSWICPRRRCQNVSYVFWTNLYTVEC